MKSLDELRSEGDLNLSEARTEWQSAYVDDETRAVLDDPKVKAAYLGIEEGVE